MITSRKVFDFARDVSEEYKQQKQVRGKWWRMLSLAQLELAKQLGMPLVEEEGFAFVEGNTPLLLEVPHGIPYSELDGYQTRNMNAGYGDGYRDYRALSFTIILTAMMMQQGNMPTVLVSKMNRKHVDMNRGRGFEPAYEDPRFEDVFESYHDRLDRLAERLQERHKQGLALHVHTYSPRIGDSKAKTVKAGNWVILGTLKGRTVKRDLDSIIAKAFDEQGVTTYRSSANAQENPFEGQSLVAHFTKPNHMGVDGVQLEINRRQIYLRFSESVAAIYNGVERALVL